LRSGDKPGRWRWLIGGCALLLGMVRGAAADLPEAAVWEALRGGGHVIVMRHALAPGTGDPAEFQVDDCATQRNLSEAGREQARRIGERLRAHGIDAARVYSSQWCRCLDTARLLRLGEVVPLPALNSFFRDRSTAAAQTAAVRAFLGAEAGEGLLVLVTHQVNITALTGVYPASGEMVVLRSQGDGLTVVGRLP
jgi:phosphohistidine phosphatase SixA